MDLRLQRNGVEYTINGMYGGEMVTQILNAESAGFVLAFSSGRTAYMSVRDSQGRPAISVQFLRGGHASATGGIFGSLRNVLSSSALRGEIAAVRAGKPERVGERNIVIATTKGRIQSWDIHRGGHTALVSEADGRESIVMAIKAQTPDLNGLLLESFELLDFTYTPKPIIDAEYGNQENNGTHLLLLGCLKSPSRYHYFLVEVVMKPGEVSIGTIRPLKSYISPVNRDATSKTRLYLPDPALVAYVVFDKAVVVLSMAMEANSPESQLRNESHLLPKNFEDVIDFREDMNIEVVGSGMEEPHAPNGIEDAKSRRHRAKYPATVLLVRGGGVIRIAATNVAKLTSNQPQQVTAKSKLEQAVFFAKKDQNLLNFALRSETQFSSQDMSVAALELSNDILRSKTPHIPSVPASVDQNLKSRLTALRDLAEYLKENDYRLDRVTKWSLLWDAERIAAARCIWERYDTSVKAKPVGQKRGLIAEIVEYIHEDYKSEPVAEAGELDRVRHWFINDTWNLEIALPWAYQVIKYAYTDGQKDHSFVMQTLSEADDLVLAALQGALDFRTSHLNLYGLGDEELEHGILKSGYENLPEFWTSTAFVVTNLRKQSELAGLMAKEYWSLAPKEGQPDPALVSKVRHEYPSIIDIMISANTERIRWDLAQDSQQLKLEAEQITFARNAAQDQHLILLSEALELPDEAIELAEKHEILGTLAYVLQSELNDSKTKLKYASPGQEEVTLWERRLAALRSRVDRCFARFGMKWAAALYDFEIGNGAIGDLLDGWPEHQSYLTEFLHSRPEYAKISWINDVIRENDFSNASETLLSLGLKREQDKWSKKIELSLGKLALLTDRKYSNCNSLLASENATPELSAVHSQLRLIKIQDQIHEAVFPSVDAAIDEKAELQLALEAHGSKALRSKTAFMSFFENSMNRLLRHEALDAPTLIDLLSLMDDNRKPQEQDDFHNQQFFFALQVILLGVPNKDEQVLLQRIVWRRCMLRDDWVEINNTTNKDDQQVSEQLANSALYLTFRACLKNRKSSTSYDCLRGN
jgi:nuclear pore complex protein Nup133